MPKSIAGVVPSGGPQRGDAERRTVERARTKIANHEPITREERHALHREYRRLEREGSGE